jgi:hypothetical protein
VINYPLLGISIYIKILSSTQVSYNKILEIGTLEPDLLDLENRIGSGKAWLVELYYCLDSNTYFGLIIIFLDEEMRDLDLILAFNFKS